MRAGKDERGWGKKERELGYSKERWRRKTKRKGRRTWRHEAKKVECKS